MKKVFSLLSALYFLTATAAPAELLQEPAPAIMAAAAAIRDGASVTEHSAVVQERKISYTATAGTMDVPTEDGVCEIFYTAYTRGNVEDAGSRPITFAIDGGPDSAGLWLHLGLLGPRRMETEDAPAQFPPTLIDNAYSILDMTDLVFIDPVGTGYSRAPEGDGAAGQDSGLRAVGDFIRLYVSRGSRWGSPKYIAGGSGGAARAVGLCQYLYDAYGMGLNGLMLFSPSPEGAAQPVQSGSGLSSAFSLPTCAALAWDRGILGQDYLDMDLWDFLGEVRGFVSGEYVPALFLGRSLDAEAREKLTERIAAYTGMEAEAVLSSGLRIDTDSFCGEVLGGQDLTPGYMDGRAADLMFSAAANQYFSGELGYQTDRPYLPLPAEEAAPPVALSDAISECLSENSFLKVWVLCGCYDAGAPFYGTQWLCNQVILDESRQESLRFSCYPTGHLFWQDEEACALFRQEAESWYNG